jgi:hypothetical protein
VHARWFGRHPNVIRFRVQPAGNFLHSPERPVGLGFHLRSVPQSLAAPARKAAGATVENATAASAAGATEPKPASTEAHGRLCQINGGPHLPIADHHRGAGRNLVIAPNLGKIDPEKRIH